MRADLTRPAGSRWEKLASASSYTSLIFSKVFDSEFHRDNNVARELYRLGGTIFTGGLRKRTLKGLEAYYAAFRAAAAQIGNHHEKADLLEGDPP